MCKLHPHAGSVHLSAYARPLRPISLAFAERYSARRLRTPRTGTGVVIGGAASNGLYPFTTPAHLYRLSAQRTRHTAIGAYSPRARAGFPAAAPVTWAQVERGIRPDVSTIARPPPRDVGHDTLHLLF